MYPTIGTCWKYEPSTGSRPISLKRSATYCDAMSPPVWPGPLPMYSSDDSTRIHSRIESPESATCPDPPQPARHPGARHQRNTQRNQCDTLHRALLDRDLNLCEEGYPRCKSRGSREPQKRTITSWKRGRRSERSEAPHDARRIRPASMGRVKSVQGKAGKEADRDVSSDTSPPTPSARVPGPPEPNAGTAAIAVVPRPFHASVLEKAVQVQVQLPPRSPTDRTGDVHTEEAVQQGRADAHRNQRIVEGERVFGARPARVAEEPGPRAGEARATRPWHARTKSRAPRWHRSHAG